METKGSFVVFLASGPLVALRPRVGGLCYRVPRANRNASARGRPTPEDENP